MNGIEATHERLREVFDTYTQEELWLLAIGFNALSELSKTRPEIAGPLAYLVGCAKLSTR